MPLHRAPFNRVDTEESMMHITVRRAALLTLTVLALSQSCLAGAQPSAPSTHMAALDDQALTTIHGAGLETQTLLALTQNGKGKDGNTESGKRGNQANQASWALVDSLDRQVINAQTQLATTASQTAVAAATTASTAVMVAPLTALVPMLTSGLAGLGH
jgi:hypothetical protein